MSSPPLYIGPLLHLRTLPAFADLSAAQLRDLAYEASEVVLQRGGALIEEGETGAAMYLIVDGFVDSGGEIVGPGGVVGFLDALSAGPAGSRAEADTEVVALRLETDALRDVCEQNFAVLGALLEHIAQRVSGDVDALIAFVDGGDAAAVEAGPSLDRVERMLALQRSAAFPREHMDALAELAGHVDEVRLPGGLELWEAGHAIDGFFVVCSGMVLLHGGSWGDVDIGPGSVPGLVETLAGRTPGYGARTGSPTTLLRVHAEPFMDVLEDHFEMAYGLLARLTRLLVASGAHPSARSEAEDG